MSLGTVPGRRGSSRWARGGATAISIAGATLFFTAKRRRSRRTLRCSGPGPPCCFLGLQGSPGRAGLLSGVVRPRQWSGVSTSMGDAKELPLWRPITEAERCTALDAIRGLALLGVLLVNLHSNFRVSLAEDLLGPPPSHR